MHVYYVLWCIYFAGEKIFKELHFYETVSGVRCNIFVSNVIDSELLIIVKEYLNRYCLHASRGECKVY